MPVLYKPIEQWKEDDWKPEIEDLHWVTIKVQTRMGGGTVEFLKWSELPFPVRVKWDWYFTYRAALLQVKYPRYIVHLRWGHEPLTENERKLIDLRNKVRAAKRKVTQYENKIAAAINHYNSLGYIFPIEDQPEYKAAQIKLQQAKDRLQCLIKEYEHMNKEQTVP